MAARGRGVASWSRAHGSAVGISRIRRTSGEAVEPRLEAAEARSQAEAQNEALSQARRIGDEEAPGYVEIGMVSPEYPGPTTISCSV